MNDNEFAFTVYELKRLSNLLKELDLDAFVKYCHSREAEGVQPYVTREARFQAEKAIEFLVETNVLTVNTEEDECIEKGMVR